MSDHAVRETARELLAGDPDWVDLARAGWLSEQVTAEVVFHEEAGASLLPLWVGSTAALAPLLPAGDRAAIARGDARWVLADGPLAVDPVSATSTAIVGGDTVWELAGATSENLATLDETRPLGVVVGGEVVRPLFPSERLGTIRARLLVTFAAEAVGVARAASALAESSDAPSEEWIVAARHAVLGAAEAVDANRADAQSLALRVRAGAVRAALHTTHRAVVATRADTWESPAQRLRRRALWLGLWDAPGERLVSEPDDEGGSAWKA